MGVAELSWDDNDLKFIRSFEKLGCISNIFDQILAHSFGKSGLTPVHFTGTIITKNHEKETEKVTNYEYSFDTSDTNLDVKVLLDTGALCANYVSKNLFEDIMIQLNDNDIKQQKTKHISGRR